MYELFAVHLGSISFFQLDLRILIFYDLKFFEVLKSSRTASHNQSSTKSLWSSHVLFVVTLGYPKLKQKYFFMTNLIIGLPSSVLGTFSCHLILHWFSLSSLSWFLEQFFCTEFNFLFFICFSDLPPLGHVDSGWASQRLHRDRHSDLLLLRDRPEHCRSNLSICQVNNSASSILIDLQKK